MNKPVKLVSEELVEHIKEFDHCYIGALRDEEGRVTAPVESNGNERKHVGLTDTEENFFYIRYRDGWINYEEIKEERKFSSCETSIEQVIPVRMVGRIPDHADSYRVESEIRATLLRWRMLPQSGIKLGRIYLRQSNVDTITIMKEEFKKVKKFDKAFKAILFDFDISIEMSVSCDAKTLSL